MQISNVSELKKKAFRILRLVPQLGIIGKKSSASTFTFQPRPSRTSVGLIGKHITIAPQ